jgi:flagellar biosynthetic protein FlhB
MPGENKSEKATPRRRQKAREEGRVARTPELGAALAMAAGLWVFSSQFVAGLNAWRGTWSWALGNAATGDIRPAWFFVLLGQVAWRWMVPVLLTAFVVALVGSLAQGGLVFAPAMLQPKLERISPVAKLQQIFSMTSLVGLGKSLIPAAAMVWLVAAVFLRDWPRIVSSGAMSPEGFAAALGSRLFEASWKCGLVLVLWAAVDYLARRQKLEGDLRMTKQEVREEVKESEGNPQIKVRIRKLQRQVRRKQMLESVRRAAVVVTNPTEYAIALEYNERLVAPVVVAKGRNLLAQQIKDEALWHDVPTVENVPLAHALYRTAEVGQAIPAKLYAAVAEVLAFIFRAQARAKAQAEARAKVQTRTQPARPPVTPNSPVTHNSAVTGGLR